MDQVTFLKAAITARILQLYYHYCHNLVTGPTFNQDHASFGEYYEQLEDNYDTIIEYMISILGNSSLNTKTVNQVIMEKLSNYNIESMSAEEMFEEGLKLEEEFQDALEVLDEEACPGLKNAIGAMAEISDNRKYKIQQRLK